MYNEDIIYHYTKASTAIDYILHSQKLRFSKSILSNDPIESIKILRPTSYYDDHIDKKQTKQHHEDLKCIHKIVEDCESKFSQICFCKNTFNDDDNDSPSTLDGNEEQFGFTKLRMWDQYADRYNGVCIAFSKEKIMNNNKDKFNLIAKDIVYLTFQDLFSKKVGNIQGNHLNEVGIDKYSEQVKDQLTDSFYCKHLDYSGENEFRIGALFDREKCTPEYIRGEIILDQNMMLDITNCIEAIFFSSFANSKQKDDLLDYANKLSVPLIEMKWQHNAIKAIDYKCKREFTDSLVSNDSKHSKV